MAADNQQQDSSQYTSIYSLSIPAGIKRDGTIFQNDQFTDGVWCRFQRLEAKKIGGYRTIFTSLNGIYRGMVAQPYNGVNYIFAGNAQSLDVFTTGLTYAIGSGPFSANILPGQAQVPIYAAGSNYIDVLGDQSVHIPAGTKFIFTQTSTATVYTVATSVYSATPLPARTRLTFTASIPSSPTGAWIANSAVFTPDPAAGPYRITWQFDVSFNPIQSGLYVLAHPGYNLQNIDNGIASQVLVGLVTPTSGNTWTFNGLADTGGQYPTYKPISVDGGVCVLHPFVFVYGSNGFIANNNVDLTAGSYSLRNFYDWNGPFANQLNMSPSKIVKGLPMRGGTNSPAGLFWATDSLIRVTFNSQSTTGIYWNYDIISSQISIMSSNSIVEMDGVYFWMGVDRFYLYNGTVKVLPNDKNVNWLFDNLNYEERQKVWATKIPRYNEIWFFYPRGTDVECTDAIIYNTKDDLWYDAGQAIGSQRSCGYTTELFPTPIWADWNYVPFYSTPSVVINHPASLPAPSTSQIYIAGDVTQEFSPGDSLSFSTGADTFGQTYLVTSSIHIYNTTIGTPGVTRITCSTPFLTAPTAGTLVYYVSGGFNIWQHEFGQNQVGLDGEVAVYSSITTSDISWLTGSPSQDGKTGINRRMHMRRVEPNFLQTGNMSMTILGRKFAGGQMEENSGPYYFNQDTGKIDLRVEHRLVRLQFVSNEINGNYEMGRNLITAELGDERP
jgi:hypothetical protein